MAFSKGDVVILKSGGPKMSVVDIGDYGPMGPEDGVKCVWFDKTKKFEDVFDAVTLRPVSGMMGTVSLSRA
jgi:uncharacterized protein YodC (DUF2158 family)